MRVAKLNTRSNVMVGDQGEMSTFFANSKGDVVECLEADKPGEYCAGDFSVIPSKYPNSEIIVPRLNVGSYTLAYDNVKPKTANPMAAAHAALAAKRAAATP